MLYGRKRPILGSKWPMFVRKHPMFLQKAADVYNSLLHYVTYITDASYKKSKVANVP